MHKLLLLLLLVLLHKHACRMRLGPSDTCNSERKHHLVTLLMPQTDLRHHQLSNDLYTMAFSRHSYI